VSKLLVAPLEALTDKRLSESERKVLLVLFSFRGKVSDTVWPGREKIAERSNIKDTGRISKITTSLADLGWLKKSKKGFSGYNTYRLTFPDALVAESTTNEDLPIVAESTTSIVAESTTSIVAESTTCNKQTRITNQNNTPDCGGDNPPKPPQKQKPKKPKFQKPTIDQIVDYKNELNAQGKNYISDPQQFFDYHESAGWVIGKSLKPMKCWKSAFHTWERNQKLWEKQNASKQRGSNSMRGRDILDALNDRSWAGV
jgi:hypothetical protein